MANATAEAQIGLSNANRGRPLGDVCCERKKYPCGRYGRDAAKRHNDDPSVGNG